MKITSGVVISSETLGILNDVCTNNSGSFSFSFEKVHVAN